MGDKKPRAQGHPVTPQTSTPPLQARPQTIAIAPANAPAQSPIFVSPNQSINAASLVASNSDRRVSESSPPPLLPLALPSQIPHAAQYPPVPLQQVPQQTLGQAALHSPLQAAVPVVSQSSPLNPNLQILVQQPTVPGTDSAAGQQTFPTTMRSPSTSTPKMLVGARTPQQDIEDQRKRLTSSPDEGAGKRRPSVPPKSQQAGATATPPRRLSAPITKPTAATPLSVPMNATGPALQNAAAKFPAAPLGKVAPIHVSQMMSDGTAFIDVGIPLPPAPVHTPQDRYPWVSDARRLDESPSLSDLARTHSWSSKQAKLYTAAFDLLHDCYTWRLASTGHDAMSGKPPREETVLCLNAARTAEKFRQLLATISWDESMTLWLNVTLLDNLSRELLEIYIDVLRQLHSKIPDLCETRGLCDARGSRRFGGMVHFRQTIVKPLLSVTPSVPVGCSFPVQPLVVLAPGEYSWTSGYLNLWRERFALIGKVVMCAESQQKDSQSLMRVLIKKLKELRQKHEHKRPIILIGSSLGSKVAMMAAANEPVDVVVCMGIHLQNISNNPDYIIGKSLFSLPSPTLFAIGSLSRACTPSAVEGIRTGMTARNKLVIVRDADEHLQIPVTKRIKVHMTQTMSDQLVFNEIASFLADVLANFKERLVDIAPQMQSLANVSIAPAPTPSTPSSASRQATSTAPSLPVSGHGTPSFSPTSSGNVPIQPSTAMYPSTPVAPRPLSPRPIPSVSSSPSLQPSQLSMTTTAPATPASVSVTTASPGQTTALPLLPPQITASPQATNMPATVPQASPQPSSTTTAHQALQASSLITLVNPSVTASTLMPAATQASTAGLQQSTGATTPLVPPPSQLAPPAASATAFSTPTMPQVPLQAQQLPQVLLQAQQQQQPLQQMVSPNNPPVLPLQLLAAQVPQFIQFANPSLMPNLPLQQASAQLSLLSAIATSLQQMTANAQQAQGYPALIPIPGGFPAPEASLLASQPMMMTAIPQTTSSTPAQPTQIQTAFATPPTSSTSTTNTDSIQRQQPQ